MQENQTNNTEQSSMTTDHISIGEMLVHARNRAALGQGDLAEQINLPLRSIQALENDEFDLLPESTFVRGYLRNYARAVGMDPEHVIDTYNKQYYVEPEIVVTPGKKLSYDPAIVWSTVAVFTILTGLMITWWFDSSISEIQQENSSIASVTNATQTKEQTKTVVDTSQVEEPKVINASESEPYPAEAEQVLTKSTLEHPELEQALQEQSNSPNLLSMNQEVDVLTVTYVEKSWTEIRDADSKTLMQGLIEPGVVRNLNGKAPFEIFLGNSPGVVIEVNGQFFDHSEYNRSNRTARFQVSAHSIN